MEPISLKIFLYIIIVFSAVLHEYAHGWMAYRLGDSTAKDAGRLTLNPIVHLDPMGTVIIPIFLLLTSGIFIGWAKPVPYNPYNLRDPKYGSLKVGIAGPLSNLVVAIILGLLLRFSLINYLAFGGMEPIFSTPLIGIIVYINIFLALFNLIPLPPLDGSKVFADLFPRYWKYFMYSGFFGILLALFIAFYILSPIAQFVFRIIVGQGFGL